MGNKIILVPKSSDSTASLVVSRNTHDFCFSHPIIHNHGQSQRRVHTQIEHHYCQRLTELVDLKMFDEAHAIFEEFSLGDDESYQWFFIQLLEDTTNE